MFGVELHKRRVRYASGVSAVFWTLRWDGTDGKRYSESIGKVGVMTKNQAETARKNKELAIFDGTLGRDRPADETLRHLIERDIEENRGTVKRDTLQAIRHAGAHAIAAWGPDIKVGGISGAFIPRLKKKLLDELGLSPTTYAKTIRTLRAVFARAERAGVIQRNPFMGTRLPKTPSRAKRVYRPEESEAMRTVSTPWWSMFILLAESTGLRKSELLHLHWTDIDAEHQTLTVVGKRPGSFSASATETLPILEWCPKRYEMRTVPISAAVIAALHTWKRQMGCSPYVFLTVDRLRAIQAEIAEKGRLGDNYELINNIKARFDHIQRLARSALATARGIPVDQVPWPIGTVHDLRRTYGTRMSRVVPMHVLKEYMGHANITTTQEYYLAAETQDAEAARKAMEAVLMNRANGSAYKR